MSALPRRTDANTTESLISDSSGTRKATRVTGAGTTVESTAGDASRGGWQAATSTRQTGITARFDRLRKRADISGSRTSELTRYRAARLPDNVSENPFTRRKTKGPSRGTALSPCSGSVTSQG